MARAFTGTTNNLRFAAGAGGITLTNFSIAFIARRTAETTVNVLYISYTAGALRVIAFYPDTAAGSYRLWLEGLNTDRQALTLDWRVADNWVLVGVSKTSGVTTPRFHKYVFDTGVWSHDDATGTGQNPLNTVAEHRLSDYNNGTTLRWEGDIAAGAFWDRVLADAEYELLALSLTDWYASAPKTLWLLDQQATGQNVPDLTGGGANQNGITGTTVSTEAVPQFSYGLPMLYPAPGVAVPPPPIALGVLHNRPPYYVPTRWR